MATVKELVAKFAWSYHVPVELSEVISALREMGIQDEIRFFRDSQLPKNTILGYFTRWRDPTTEKFVSTITYAVLDDPNMERFICCKELLHILDPENSRVRSEDELRDQIAKIILPLHLQDPFNESAHVLTDRIAEIQAIAVLFPYNARNTMLEKFRAGKLTFAQIADLSQLPIEYVSIVMSDKWQNFYKHLLPGENRDG